MSSIQLFSQDTKAIELQKYWISKAQQDLHTNNVWGAFCQYYFAYEMAPDNEEGKNSLELADSLRTILRTDLKHRLKGVWKIHVFGRIKSENDRAHYTRLGKFLKISDDSIVFFKRRTDLKSNNFKSKQAIKFCDLETMLPVYNDIIHSNGNIWNYHVEENGEVLRITDSGELLGDKSRSEIISHPSGYTYKRIR
ncbi:hypothetical protein [Zeaxanthinibacter enoshimensis]|uniref:hypothetical protein n=1 Tax=Zeaxanthinibacter enoshimensis TaxID=392009 RepID=UPI00105EC73D|nr:hypothetical protein [Zeaxanthinibacter enoshimensis]